MSGGWQISVGDVYETMRPALYVLAALCSAWVLADARRHGGFRLYAVWAWTLSSFLFPPVVLPLYLVARMFTPRADTSSTPSQLDDDAAVEPARASGEDDTAGSARIPARLSAEARTELSLTSTSPGTEHSERAGARLRAEMPALPAKRLRFAPPVLYAAALALAGAFYFYQDYRSFDAHLARAARAKVDRRRERAVSEYRAALGLAEDAHTRKLLGLELLKAGRAEEALAELRAAERGGEPDEMLAYHVGSALEAAGRPGEAASSYLTFLRSGLCARTPPSAGCEGARARVRHRGSTAAP